jgi:hypothetical protein
MEWQGNTAPDSVPLFLVALYDSACPGDKRPRCALPGAHADEVSSVVLSHRISAVSH